MLFKDSLKTIAVSLIILSLIGVVYAWTEPTQNPPLGNAAPPISTDATGQTKIGLLGLRNGLMVYDSNVEILGNGKLGIGVTPDANSPALNISSAADEILKLTRQGATQPTTFRQGTDGALVIENGGRDIMTIKDGNISIAPTTNYYEYIGRESGTASINATPRCSCDNDKNTKDCPGSGLQHIPTSDLKGSVCYDITNTTTGRADIYSVGDYTTSNTLTANGGLIIKSLVSSDPASPADGEMWMRQDSEHTYNSGNSTPSSSGFCGPQSNNGYALDLKSIQHWWPEVIVYDIHPTQGQEDIENGYIWFRFYRHGQNGSSPYSDFKKFQINSNGSFNDPSYGAGYVYEWELSCNPDKTSCDFKFRSSVPVDQWGNPENYVCGWNTITFNPQNRYLSDLSLKIYKNGKVWKSTFTPQ